MRAVVKGFLYFVYIVIVGGLLAAIILTFHHDHASAPAVSKPVHQQVAKAKASVKKKAAAPKEVASGATTKANSSATSKQSQPASTSSRPSSTSQSAGSKTSASSTSTSLTNTGPGSTIGLFAAASLGGILLRRRQLLRHLN